MRKLILIQIVALAIAGSSFLYAYETLRSNIIQQCQQQNQRHDRTLHFLENYIAYYELTHKMTPAQKKIADQQAQADIVLINDLQPHRNCKGIY